MFARPAGILLAFASLTAHAAVVEINWTPDGRFGYEALLDAAAVAEVCGPLAAGSVVDWKLKSGSPLDFNIHFHQGDNVVYPTQEAGVTALEDRLTATEAQTYCWMLTNKQESAAVIELDLQLNPD